MVGNSRPTASIDILDDDSLLHVFWLYRPFILGEGRNDTTRLWGGEPWVRGRWWYTLAHVCRRWRNIILGSASYLGVSAVCTFGKPVADMLAHSPPLPLAIDYFLEGRDIKAITTDDEEGAILVLKQFGRVRHVRFELPVRSQQKLIATMDEEYPILEYLVIGIPIRDLSTTLIFPETFQAPHLRHLRLCGFYLPTGSRLLTSAVGLVTLSLVMVQPSTYFHPNTLLQWVSLMPQLETLTVYFNFPIPNRDVVRQLTHAPIIALVTLPNLHCFQFHGVGTYFEALVHWIATPRIKKLTVELFDRPPFYFPRLLQLMNTAENLSFHGAYLRFFDDRVVTTVYPHRDIWEADVYALEIRVICWQLDLQLSFMERIVNSLSQIFSVVEHLELAHYVPGQSPGEVNRTLWRRLLGPFSNVKTLRIDNGIVKYLSRCLRLDDGEPPLEVLPELKELTYCGRGDTGDAFTSLIDARQNVGRPVTLVRL